MKNFFLPVILFFTYFNVYSQDFVRSKFEKTEGYNSGQYRSMTFNGSWCWFSDPRAVYYEGEHKRTYTGWVDNYGDIHIACFDHETNEINSRVIFDSLEIDDHNNPSILFDSEGKLLVFFNMHMRGIQPLFLIKSEQPESIDEWGEVKELYLNDDALSDMGSMNHTYTNPVRLSGEDNRIYLFWRGIDGKPSYSFSDNKGETWAKGKIFFMPERIYGFRRPYTKIYSDGKEKIHIIVTDGHPRKEKENNIYYMYYYQGAFYKADGSKIKEVDQGPVLPSEADLVYDARKSGAKSWNWDIAVDSEEKPVIAYAKFPDDSTHIYCYAKWNGKEWKNYDLVNSGRWFPETPEGKIEPEPNYSGGMNIDHESPDIVYLSVKRDSIFEIEKWQTKNEGKSWRIEKISSGSAKHNVRPFAVRGATGDNPMQVLWMQNTKYLYFAYHSKLRDLGGDFSDRFHSSIKMDVLSPEIDKIYSHEAIERIMIKTADWQLANPKYSAHPLNWHYGALYTGIRALYELSGKNRYLNELINIGQWYKWKPMDDIFHADRLTIVDTWAWLYDLTGNQEMIDKARWAMDIHIARRYEEATDVSFKNNPYKFEWWTWCDALFMAPPSFVEMWRVTGEEKYLEYMDKQWWKTSDYLYSEKDSLYFRDDRFFEERTENDKKVFWARGNGWVIAGLARILDRMPQDYEGRERFEDQFREMAHKLLSIQNDDGLWRVSLLDPEYLDIGESSGSAFFTFALAWGINNGLIDKRYSGKVKKAWAALCNNVNESGRLGYVQQVAGSPYPFYEDEFHVYATGAFLLAGSEIYLMATD